MESLEELRFCAKYPFTKEAKDFLAKADIDLGAVAEDATAMDTARERVAKAKDPRAELNEINASSNSDFLTNKIISFPAAKIIALLSGDYSLLRQWARNETRRAYHFLQLEDEETLAKIASQFFSVTREGSDFVVPFQQYLACLPEGKEYSLINQRLEKGRIYLPKERFVSLISQYVAYNISKGTVERASLPKMFLFYGDELKKAHAVPDVDLGKAEFNLFPPCMKHVVSDLQSGSKVGHNARFVLGTFLSGIKMPIDEAVILFKNQPNFNEKKTRYYLEHAAGGKSSAVKYSAPGCAKIESYGLCYRDAACKWKHPLSYYKAMKFPRKKFVRK
jgi:DNA primase large subunit